MSDDNITLFDARQMLSKEDFEELTMLIELSRISTISMKQYNRFIELWGLVERFKNEIHR